MSDTEMQDFVALEAELAELRKDKARLDWLEVQLLGRHHGCSGYEYIGIEAYAGSITNLTAVSDESGAEVTAKDIRSAIDAAMEASK